MRITKFRGWNTKHKKRIYGDLFRSRGEWFITQDGIVPNPLAEPEDWRVGPESVGQSTGLLDKNGKEIYEGDIIESTRPAKEKYLVFWDKEDAAFYGRHELFESRFRMSDILNCVIVGNIHENPELINR